MTSYSVCYHNCCLTRIVTCLLNFVVRRYTFRFITCMITLLYEQLTLSLGGGGEFLWVPERFPSHGTQFLRGCAKFLYNCEGGKFSSLKLPLQRGILEYGVINSVVIHKTEAHKGYT